MTEKRKRAAGAGTPNSARTVQALTTKKGCKAIVADKEPYGKSCNADFLRFYENIPMGAANAISMQQLADFYGVTARELRKAVLAARCGGCIIAGDENGYYKPDGLAELKAYYKRALSRGRATFASIAAARQQIEELERQQEAEV